MNIYAYTSKPNCIYINITCRYKHIISKSDCLALFTKSNKP